MSPTPTATRFSAVERRYAADRVSAALNQTVMPDHSLVTRYLVAYNADADPFEAVDREMTVLSAKAEHDDTPPLSTFEPTTASTDIGASGGCGCGCHGAKKQAGANTSADTAGGGDEEVPPLPSVVGTGTADNDAGAWSW